MASPSRLVRLCALLAALVAVPVTTLPAFGQATVRRVEVQLLIDGPAPYQGIRERLTATVQSVTDRLLVGRPLEQLTPLVPRLGETIAGVVDRVATGYVVAAAEVQLGAVAVAVVRLRPVGTIIQDVAVTGDLRAVHARLHALAGSLLERASPQIRALYVGLPSAALEWADPILEARAREAIEGALPGFTALLRAHVADGRVAVEAVVLPRDARVIRNIGVRFRSTSIPSMLLDQHGPAVASMAEPLRGLPVAFAQAHRPALERLIAEELAAYPPARQYRMVATAGLDVAETTYVTVIADSLLFRARVEAQLNIGTRAPGPSVVGHLGRVVAPGTEAFFELHLVPNTLSLEWQFGAQYEFTPGTAIGVSYAIAAGQATAWTALQLGADTGLRANWNLTTQAFEGAVTYRFNENLAGEIIANSRGDVWLRLISNL